LYHPLIHYPYGPILEILNIPEETAMLLQRMIHSTFHIATITLSLNLLIPQSAYKSLPLVNLIDMMLQLRHNIDILDSRRHIVLLFVEHFSHNMAQVLS
jgi:hypothetical protein